jgi:tetratricopeptide (TPR) repeat protein
MELSTIRQQIENILKDVNKIEENTGIGIQQKKAGNLHISTNEVLFKEVWSKALEYYHKKEYIKAIKLYDKAIVIDPDSALAWDFKGDALDKLGKHDEPAKCHQKPIEIDPNLGVTLA